MATAFFGGPFFGGEFFSTTVVVVGGGPVPAKGPARRIHPRWIREDEESELPEVIRKRTKLTKKVEALLKKQEAITEVKLDLAQNKRELDSALSAATMRLEAERQAANDEEDDWLLLML